MKCSQCKESLAEYIEGNLSVSVDEEIKEHLLECENCKEAYEREKLEYEAFKAAFSIEDIKFENIAPKVMDAIDKEKYANNVKRKRKNKYIAPIAAALLICVAISPVALKYINGGEKISEYVADGASLTEEDKGVGIQETRRNPRLEKSVESNENESLEKENYTEANYVELYSIRGVLEPLIEYNTPYIVTEDDRYEATISGKGEYAQEEGIGTIYVKNNSTSEILELKLKNDDRQMSPLSISWYDDKHLIVVQGFAYGTLANGVDIVVINMETGEQMLIATVDESSLISYENAYRDGNDLVVEIKKYNDDTLNEYTEDKMRIENYQLGDVIN